MCIRTVLGWVRVWREDLANSSLGPHSKVAIPCYQEQVKEACGAESSQFSLKSKKQGSPDKMPKNQELRTLLNA